jgi:hypothetical protein
LFYLRLFIQHNDTQHKGLMCDIQYIYHSSIKETKHNSNAVMLNVFILSVVMLYVIMPRIFMLNADIPCQVSPLFPRIARLFATSVNCSLDTRTKPYSKVHLHARFGAALSRYLFTLTSNSNPNPHSHTGKFELGNCNKFYFTFEFTILM